MDKFSGPPCLVHAGICRVAVLLLAATLPLFGFVLSGAAAWPLRVCAASNSLPYSDKAGEGFENRIAELLAVELEAELVHVWMENPSARATSILLLNGECDAVMGITGGSGEISATLAYYRSSYVFAYRQDSSFEVLSLDDAVLHELRIGVQAGASGISPGVYALAKRGLIENQVTYIPDYRSVTPLSQIVKAVVVGEVDVAIVWGPVAGYFAAREDVPLELTKVSPQIEVPFMPMVSSIAIGVRAGDEALRDDLNAALVRRWEEIQEILREYDVPLEPLPKPAL